MMVAEDIAQDLEQPASASTPPTPEPSARGHQPAIHAAVTALRAAGKLPPHPRPVQRERLIKDWLGANGYENDLPTRWAINRYFEWEMQGAPNAH